MTVTENNLEILLVEDDAGHVSLIQRAFEADSGKFRLTVAADLNTAQRYLETSMPGLAIIDWLLPDGSAADILPDQLEAMTYPIIIMTSHGDERLAVKSMKAGAIDYVVKSPASMAQMPRIVLRALRDWHNIVERRRAEAELRKTTEELRGLAAHLQTVREDERAAIAREIHDEFGQVLTSLKMDLSSIARDIRDGTKTTGADILVREIDAMKVRIDGTISRLRTLVTSLRPEVLDILGLVSALKWQAVEFQKRANLVCLFTSQVEELDVDKELATAVFRIFQEALTNIARHAHATEVSVNLTLSDDTIYLEISDNGIGMARDKAVAPQTFGLMGMQERALLFGGQVTVGSSDGGGTTVSVRVPLPRPGSGLNGQK